MKHTMKIIFLVFVLVLTAVSLTACGHQHEYETEWTYNGSHHWHVGSCEHKKVEDAAPDADFAIHTMGTPVRVEPTCGQSGSITTSCTVCGYTTVEVLAAEGEHTFDLDTLHSIQDGNFISRHYKCTTCQTISGAIEVYEAKWTQTADLHYHAPADAAAGLSNLNEGTHTWSDPIVKAANCGKTGTSTVTCTTCGYQKVSVLPTEGEHTYTKAVPTYSVSGTQLMENTACDTCGTVKSVPVANAKVVSNTQEAQAALDANDGTRVIYFTRAIYDVLYIKAGAEVSTSYKISDTATLLYREIDGLTLIAADLAKIAGIHVVTDSTTTDGVTTSSAISLKNITFKNLTFTGSENAVVIGENVLVDGLTVDGCKLTKLNNGKTFLSAAASGVAITSDSFAGFTPALSNITLKNCSISGVATVLSLYGAENVTVESNTLSNITGTAILLEKATNGASFTGNVVIRDNKVTKLADRFLSATALTGTVTVTNNSVTTYTGEEKDIVLITGSDSATAVSIEGNKFPSDSTITAPANKAPEA